MGQYRKKPVEVSAFQISNDILAGNYPALPEWLRTHPLLKADAEAREMWIDTLEGEMNVSDGDWVIRGIKGEIYPCKPDIFEMTYEAL